ncbi:DUF4350 domain-containing protein [Infirmifilum lucidum]|uniref:DUF4350 domain-containing protein n=1 Tax=Infirmifilum lucidum TaxID=2776706 RepID=A0A7L9FHP9_9CREN|nr:DUF4350 domain-containing protein [Infirmifilum lucidum]QOJ79289.1 DUF4350 domain-containing protein [Infirmifilum lucidum]
MKGYILLGVGLSLAVLLLLVAFIPSTDDFSPDNPLWNGLTTFCQEFNASVVDVGNIRGLPRGVVLFIVGPSANLSTVNALELRRFVERGGVLVVADDFGSGNSILGALGASTRIRGGLLEDGVFMYRSPYLPRALARVNGSTLELYLNYASVLEPGGSGVCLAYSSPFSCLDVDFNGVCDRGEPHGPFCVAYMEPIDSGRLVVFSDASIFINSMVNLGGNSAMIKNLVGSRSVYVLVGLWDAGTYTRARSLLLGVLGLVYGSSLRYISVPLTGLLMYALSLAISRRIRKLIGARHGV